jgi:ankyrin repeat protein
MARKKDLLLQLLGAGADVEACNKKGNNPLHLAAKYGYTDLLGCLTTPTTLAQQNSLGFTPLQTALLRQQWEAGALLIAAGASPEGPDDSTASLSSLATRSSGAMEPGPLLKAWLADPGPTGLAGQALSWRDRTGSTVLHNCASKGSYEQVSNLAKAGANREALDDNQRTPLCLAAMGGHAELVPLLATPATINMKSWCPALFCTPLSAAAAGGHKDMVVALLAAGAQPDEPGLDHSSPLAVAVKHGHMHLVPVLLQALASKHLRALQQGPQQQQQQQQVLQQHNRQEQQQGGQRTPSGAAVAPIIAGQAVVLQLVTAAVMPVARELQDAPRCAQLLGMVLDEVGPELTGWVCQQVQRWLPALQGSSAAHQGPGISPFWEVFTQQNRSDYLAEALLLGWIGAEGRRRIPARLQRLVPGVGEAHQQQQEDRGQQPLVWEAIVPAIYGQQQKAGALLGDCAELYLQHSSLDGSGVPGVAAQASHSPSGTFVPPQPPVTAATSQGVQPQTGLTQGHMPPLLRLVHGALVAVANMHQQQQEAGVLGPTARELTAGKVLNSFLGAWVAARSMSSQELVGAVVAAVNSRACEQQQGQKK